MYIFDISTINIHKPTSSSYTKPALLTKKKRQGIRSRLDDDARVPRRHHLGSEGAKRPGSPGSGIRERQGTKIIMAISR